MNNETLQEWFKLTEQNKQNIFNEIAEKMTLPAAAVAEKDWWVVRTLELVFQTEIAPHTVFKGGTSLSKAWNLIDRFSEDIDLALDREFLGFNKTMTNSQVKKLREHSFKYISEVYFPLLQKAFKDAGFSNVVLQLREPTSNDQDPLIVEVNYPAVTEQLEYLTPRVLIEIGSRSLIEPFSERQFSSFVGEHFTGRNFADSSITIPTVKPERTFLEKIFLLHEEFQQPKEKVKVDRQSRHLYDLEKLMDTEHGKAAISDTELYKGIVAHREKFNSLRELDYSNHIPSKIKIIPPDTVIKEWEKDYQVMTQNMIYGDPLNFDKLIKRIQELQKRINAIVH